MRIRRLGAKLGVIGGVLSLLATGLVLSPGAQAQTNLRGAAPDKKNAPPVSQRTESINYDLWMVTCREIVGSSKKACMATLRVLGSGGKQVIANWQIGLDKDNHLVSVIQVPTGISAKDKDNKVSTGILMKNGLELKLGNGAARHLNYVDCNPRFCEASTPIDETFVKEAAAAATSAITVYASNGTPIPLSFPSKGMDKAISAVSANKI